MAKFPAFVGGSYTALSSAVADEEAINLYAETIESAGAQTQRSYFYTPGTAVFATLSGTPRGSWEINGRAFAVAGTELVELFANGAHAVLGAVVDDSLPASLAASSIELLVVSGGRAYCMNLATNVVTDVTALLVGVPVKVEFGDSYFVLTLAGTNKFQISGILDGLTWPGLQVNAVSVFPEHINSISVNHRELWVFGGRHIQPYSNTGAANIYDVIPGALIEKGTVSAFSPIRLDNTLFWIDQDERGNCSAWRANGYTPQRVSTHAVETALSSYANIGKQVSYSYQEMGHLFWAVYVPGTDCTWFFDVAEGLWHKRAFWTGSVYEPHHSWNHVFAFGKHLVGDWSSSNIYELSMSYYDDAGSTIIRTRQSPFVVNEMEYIRIASLTMDLETGLGPQPPFVDGNGDPRPPQCLLQWSDDRGKTWSNVHTYDCGFAGEYKTRVIAWRLGVTRYRVFRWTASDPVPWVFIGAYIEIA